MRLIGSAAIAIELLSSLILTAFCLRAFALLLFRQDIKGARGWVIEGCLFALSLKVGAALLRTIILTTWNQIGMLVALIVLRVILSQVFAKKLGTL